MIRIMKASAGSGKTFNLAKTYIRLLLTDEEKYSYRHILAVTFTNKATDEMKSRILKELHLLAKSPKESPYFEELVAAFESENGLRKRAETVLCDILHDYGAFAVSTIDRFFQQTLKAFSREIGQFATYQVELDRESLVSESVDRVLDSLSDDNKDLLQWLTQSVMDDLEKGKRYNLENNLKTVAMTLKSDEHRAAIEEYGIDEEKEYSKENLTRMKKALSGVMTSFVKEVREAAKAFVSAAGEEGLSNEDFSRKCFNSLYVCAASDPKDELAYPSASIFKNCEDFSKWFRKADLKRYAPLERRLMPLLQKYCGIFTEKYKIYSTAFKISKILNELGIAGDLDREFRALMKEKNVLSLDDSNVILRNIIDGTDAPFIYEKLGVRFEHFLLDEFQDTSRIQWDNFRPLIENSVAQGKENLLVGDVKQSIYRWRGSDWRMMANEVQGEFSECEVETLDCNYRSLRNIVEFNNGFFGYASSVLDGMAGDESGFKVRGIYSDAGQFVKSKSPSDGSVDVVFCDKDDELQAILDAVSKVHDAGARYGEITVLVRSNKHGSDVAMFLMDKGVSVISDDSLHLKSSAVARQVVSLLSSVGNEDDTIGSFLARELDINVAELSCRSLLDLCEQLLRILKDRDPELFESETQYVQALMDFVQDYVSVNGNAIDGFLKSWQEADPKISSPSDPESVRVMTIHKSKGLEFQHVVFPFAEEIGLFRSEKHWTRPSVEGTELEGIADGVYNVLLSKPSKEDSLFQVGSQKELQFQFVDNINTFYVALTRPIKGLTVIASNPPEKITAAIVPAASKVAELAHPVVSAGSTTEKTNSAHPVAELVVRLSSPTIEATVPPCDFTDFSQILYAYLYGYGEALGYAKDESENRMVFSKGDIYNYSSKERKADGISELMPGYPSFPLNPSEEDESADVRERGRLKFSADSIEFFSDEARNDARLNGTVLHGILSEVVSLSDLPSAVRHAFVAGEIDAGQEGDYLNILTQRISAHPDWFPVDSAEVLNETGLIDTDGESYRPDRVLIKDGKVTIIDYKFGEKKHRYHRQVARYADIYHRMGYSEISPIIWYVLTDEVE